MNTLLDIAGSTVAGGLLILALMVSLFSLTDTNFIMGRTLAAQKQSVSVVQLLQSDIRMLGLGAIDSTQQVLDADSTKFTFLADLNEDGAIDTLTYSSGQSVEVNGEVVPLMLRYVNGDSANAYRFMHTNMLFSYYSKTGTAATNPDSVRSVEARLTVRDNMKYKTSDTKSFLSRRFYLINLDK